ncbi:MAG: hypothetical protein ACJ79S_01045 [Gemmatimonadaceae bacterium]
MAEETTRAPEQALRFDGPAIEGAAGAGASGAMSCSKCGTAISTYYYEAGGAVYCARCKGTDEAQGATEGRVGFGRAALFGTGAAVLGSIGYLIFTALTGWDLALVSIAVGAFVASAMRKGSRGVGGRRFQVLAVVLTYLAVGIGHLPFVLTTLQHAETAQKSSVAQQADSLHSAPGDSPAASAVDSGSAVPAGGDSASLGDKVLYGAVGVVALAVAGPFIELKHGESGSSLINLAIVAFALLQAWRMTGAGAAGAGRVTFTGPYKVAERAQAPPAGVGG